MKIFLTALWATALAVLALGCASHPRHIDCEGHLKPINAPAKPASPP